MKLIKIKKITGKIELLSGLHIGAGKDMIEIGGTDSPVLKNAITGEPYIPGSSLKGKMRSLLEWKLNLVSQNGDPEHSPKVLNPIARIFGHTNRELKTGPTRLIVRDSQIDGEQSRALIDRGILLTEVKSENTINRITSVANPRQMERAIAGLLFNLEIIYKVFDFNENGVSDDKCFEHVLEALKLVEIDCLGGGGSRGNGKIRFIDLKVEEESSLKSEKV